MSQGAGGGRPAGGRVRANLLPPPKQPGELLLWTFRSAEITRLNSLFEEKKLIKADGRKKIKETKPTTPTLIFFTTVKLAN